jgi:hypothetical protein
MNVTARLSTTKPEAAAKLLELIQMRLISEAIHVAAGVVTGSRLHKTQT